MNLKRKLIIFWIGWLLGFMALTLGLVNELLTRGTIEPVWIMAITHSYASLAILAGIIKEIIKSS